MGQAASQPTPLTAHPGTRGYFRTRRRAAGGWGSVGENVPLALLGAVIGFFVLDRPSAKENAVSALVFGLGVPVIWQCLKWTWRFFWSAPEEMYVEVSNQLADTQQRLRIVEPELEGANARILELVEQLPQPTLTPDHRMRLQKALENAGHGTVSIKYLDTPTARAGGYAWILADVFRAGGWHVEIRGERDGYENYQGLSMKLEDITHIRPMQRVVADAFQSTGIRYTQMPGHDVADRVELIVGRM